MQEDIKKIAESLGFGYLEGEIFKRHIKSKTTYGHRLFNPYESNADAFMILEAYVALTKEERGEYIELSHESVDGFSICKNKDLVASCEQDLKHAICTAYLSLIGDKDNG